MKNITKNQIEALVRNRKSGLARKAITKYLRVEGSTLDNKIEACDWYRRLGFFREAFLMIAPKKWNLNKANQDHKISHHYIWIARLLNLMGATNYAVSIAKHLDGKTALEDRVLANIYLSAYEFDKSLLYFKRAWERASVSEKKSYPARLGVLGVSDSYSGLKQFDNAIQYASQIVVDKDEGLLQGIVLQALSEYHALKGDVKKARTIMNDALSYFSLDDISFDTAIILKWNAYILALEHKSKEALDMMEKSLSIMIQNKIKAEAWLECYYLLKRLDLLSYERVLLLYTYPGVSQNFYDDFVPKVAVSIYHSKASLIIFPQRQEWWFEDKKQIGLPKEVQLISYLVCASIMGISVERLKSLLWPDEVAAYLSLQDRLSFLLGKIKKKFKVVTKIEAGMVRIIDGTEKHISVECTKDKSPPTFFINRKEFKAYEFAEYYGLQKSMSAKLLKSPEFCTFFEKVGSAAQTKYLVKIFD